MDQIKYVIGIDYGTTNSGVSYVTTTPDHTEISDIIVLRAWPGRDGDWKTPTRIAYGRENNFSGNKIGFEVKPNMVGYSWTKLLLDNRADKRDYDDPKLAEIAGSGKGFMDVPTFRNAQGVCEDFLREVRKLVFARLEKENGREFLDITPIDCWITIPEIWSDEAKDATRAAAKAAGFASRPMDSISMIPEPEAAAIATLKKYTAPGAANPIRAGEHIMIVDCGGGTVDITMYTVSTTYPVLDFKELEVGNGGKCGATYIDRNLLELMSSRFGSSFDKLSPTKRGPGSRFMQSFEIVKRDFGSSNEYRVNDIGPLKLNCVNPDHYDEDEGMVHLSERDMLNIFDPVVNQVIALVAQQVREAKKYYHSIDRMILVGGFGDSPYLYKKLSAWCKDSGRIPLFCPEDPQAAIVQGAALRGLLGTAPSSKRLRKHYGHTLGKVFRPGIDKEEDSYINPFVIGEGNDGKMVNGYMTWIISKGIEVTTETTESVELSFTHKDGGDLIHNLQLYETSLDVPQNRCEDDRVVKVGQVIVDHTDIDLNTVLTTWKDGKQYWQLEFELKIQFSAASGVLEFSSWVKGQRSGITHIKYEKN